ncbi:cell division protein FtsA [Thermohalobacter berrensis]|uniref:Chaperone protein DnaK n=1 Tax=Thermohalobacter berrensis TaxID=99594 RepID=A0A419SV34_9FIRM|nr:cell division FtsA domain-containing protein [Thermohalobacter berrensis]RKD29081.1 actin-like ATPase involved in cell division [Thermohalobacter berrensis]
MEKNQLVNIEKEQLIFSLDIGTRTVIGIVGILDKDDKFKILATEVEEHKERYMYDGQIHDINGVTKIVKRIKENLEKTIGVKLEKVAIAAAGRALKTYRVSVEREIDINREIDKRIVESLEMEAIQKAQELLDKERKQSEAKYYCVGYTVVNYYLDGNFIENLEGHRGNNIGVDVIATFLPHVVVDSLYTVMNRVGLEVINMTLEPIAAINVAIKKNLRLLNLALVDIGAGTSDIAITKDGTIVAYAMVSVAGDEITEKIAKTYLLDYDTAEKLKVCLNKQNEHVFQDIVGIEHRLKTEEILQNIEESIDYLAKEIAYKILEYNEKAPSAVFLIGGGSQIPKLPEYISKYVKLPKERVVIKGIDSIDDVEEIPDELIGPHAITPIGIGIKAIKDKSKDFLEVTVNGQKIKLFNSKSIKVSDALVLIGFNPKKLIPRRGENFKYYLNEEEKVIKGEIGNPAEIYVNNKKANLEYKLRTGDKVEVKEATQGRKPKPRLYDCIDIDKKIIFNGREINLIGYIKVNGDIENENILIKENDKIETLELKTVKELFDYLGLNTNEYLIYKNGNLAKDNEIIKDKDIIESKLKELKPTHKVKSKNKISGRNKIRLIINGKEKTIRHNKDKFIFIDIFDYIDFDLSKPKGILMLEVNGNRAEYIQELRDGDRINIYWKRK